MNDSAPSPTPPVASFAAGVATGVAGTAAFALLLLAAVVAPELRALLGAHADVLPSATRLVLHPAWAYGAPGLVAVALVRAHLTRTPRGRLVTTAAAAVAGLGALAVTLVSSFLPMFPLG